MLSQHWTDFHSSGSSGIDNFYGGINPEYTYSAYKKVSTVFCAVTYRLKVAAAQNGYHHFMGMYTGVQGVGFANASVKQNCRPGYYQFCLHFHFIKPHYSVASGTGSGPQGADGSTDNWYFNSYSTSMFFGQGSEDGYGTAGTWSGGALDGKVQDIMVFRPTLVSPTDANSRVNLWNTASSNYTGWQPFFTGIPLVDPNNVDNNWNV
jgi:hypothetical protein